MVGTSKPGSTGEAFGLPRMDRREVVRCTFWHTAQRVIRTTRASTPATDEASAALCVSSMVQRCSLATTVTWGSDRGRGRKRLRERSRSLRASMLPDIRREATWRGFQKANLASENFCPFFSVDPDGN